MCEVLIGLSGAQLIAEQIASHLGQSLSRVTVQRFSDGELLVKVKPSLRGKNVYLIQSTAPPVNEHLMELLIAVQAIRLASAEKINVILTYYGYARQDRKSQQHEPITSKLIANLLTAAGADRVLLVDIHSPMTLGYFNIPVDSVRLFPLFCQQIIDLFRNRSSRRPIALVSPDYGGLLRVREIAKMLKVLKPNVAFIDKHRTNPNQSEVIGIMGNVKGRTCFIIDDMIDTAGSIVNAAKVVKDKGAEAIYVIATHGVFSPPAVQRLNQAVKSGLITQIIVSDTIHQRQTIAGLKVFSCASWIAQFLNCLIKKNAFSVIYQLAKTNIAQTLAGLALTKNSN